MNEIVLKAPLSQNPYLLTVDHQAETLFATLCHLYDYWRKRRPCGGQIKTHLSRHYPVVLLVLGIPSWKKNTSPGVSVLGQSKCNPYTGGQQFLITTAGSSCSKSSKSKYTWH